ncbi:Tigger transposable element-derived protein 1 [Trichinella papuae]|uniref:Tigger transposable element-derived protein 1 n=1 Tax=Trichinella papuae TaxID=268474 RepID=A0A0V1MFK0_9BILA|nr:Tigger transposable element-derived protein 1 [Trichinella papuae]
MDPKGTSVSGDVWLLDKVNGGMSFAGVGRVFGISESTAHYIHKNEKALTTKAASQGREKALIKMETALSISLDNQKRKRVPVDSNAIRKKARVLYGRLKQAEPSTSSRSTFAAGKGWFDHIIRRSSLRNVMMSGEAASADQFAASSYLEQLKHLIEEKLFRPELILNADESALFWKKMPSRTFIAKEQHHISGFKTRKDKITLLCCCNVAVHIIKPGLIYKAAKPRAIKHCDEKSLHVHWMHNKKAWTIRNLFLYWFHRCFITETKRYLSALDLEFKVLLILDNATGHPENLQFASEDVDVAFLSPNTSSLIQLLNQRAYYTRSFIARLVAAMDEDSHLEVIDYWKKFSIADFLKSEAEVVNSFWRSLWPGCVKTKSTFLAADEEPHAVNMTVALAHLVDGSGFKDLQELEVIELIESHTSKLTDELLVEITGSTDEESDADEDSATDETEK